LATDLIQATNQGAAAGTSAGRILVVDDERRILNFVARGLRAEGYEGDVAEDGQRGLRAALDSAHDLIILDLVMPDLSGQAVLHGILARKPNQAVLVLSCLTDTPTKVEVLEYEELGMEAVWKIEVRDFPAFVVVDDKGNDFFSDVSRPIDLGSKKP